MLFFIVVLGVLLHGDTSIDKEVHHYYDTWKQTYVVAEKNGMYRIATDKKDKHRTVSEGQGFGMLIMSMMEDKDAQKIFNGLYLFSRVYSSSLAKDLMSWQVPEFQSEWNSAFDGDADIAYALIIADKKWGSQGLINYKKEANKVLDAIFKHTIGKQSFLPLLGDWVDENGKKFNQYTTRTSDFMIGHFKTFYRFTGEKKWLNVVSAVQKATLDVQHPKTGLIPDFIVYDKKIKKFIPAYEGFLEQNDGDYYYNGCRIPFRIGVDAVLNGDKTSAKIMQKLSHWVKTMSKNNPLNIKSGFKLDGTVIGNYFSIVFVAPFGVAAMVDDKAWSKKIYDTIKTRHENYYEDSVALLCMMVMNGQFVNN